MLLRFESETGCGAGGRLSSVDGFAPSCSSSAARRTSSHAWQTVRRSSVGRHAGTVQRCLLVRVLSDVHHRLLLVGVHYLLLLMLDMHACKRTWARGGVAEGRTAPPGSLIRVELGLLLTGVRHLRCLLLLLRVDRELRALSGRR
jgi:hypothetical protein